MSSEKCGIIVNGISLSPDASYQEAFSISAKRLKSIGIRVNESDLHIFRKSVDARHRDDVKIVYSVFAEGNFGNLNINRLRSSDFTIYSQKTPEIELGGSVHESDIVVVGSGPAGLFCALMLAEQGYRPILLERGSDVSGRMRAVEEFKRTRKLNTSSNIQFGAGGAGTFSDGKLVTRINDALTSYVLETFVSYGADKEILYSARPHIGTDVLAVVVDRIVNRIKELGGSVHFNTTFKNYRTSGDRVVGVVTDSGEFSCSALVLAIGHSARDTYTTLISNGLDIEAKPFSVGMRIEHPTELIDRSLYGKFSGHPSLGHAEYNLSWNTKDRGVYTFCMCPGGVVVPAASELGGVVSNGMSYHARNGKNSNSAVCCSIFKEDFGGSALGAIELQRKIERAAFIAGGQNYSAPICTVGDFLNQKYGSEPTVVEPTYMDGLGVKLSSPEAFLPQLATENIRAAIQHFDKKISGFAMPEAILTGAETRTSAPLRILRDKLEMHSIKYDNLYPIGEGAGYAGGITSAAIDGIKCALAIMKKYMPKEVG